MAVSALGGISCLLVRVGNSGTIALGVESPHRTCQPPWDFSPVQMMISVVAGRSSSTASAWSWCA